MGKALLEADALLTASAVAGSTEPAQGNVCAGSHLPRLLTLSHPSRPAMCSQSCPPIPTSSALCLASRGDGHW